MRHRLDPTAGELRDTIQRQTLVLEKGAIESKHMAQSSSTSFRAFDRFELAAALLLGLAAIGAAFAGYQSGLWGGRSTEAYGLAATTATKASNENTFAVMTMSRDYSVDIQAKRLILEGDDATDEATQLRSFEIASYLYTVQLSEVAFKDLGLPMEFRQGDASKRDDIQGAVLDKALNEDLGPDYVEAMLAKGKTMFADSDKKFEEGRTANETGDKFGLISVIYTVALFFGGLALVFKSNQRWLFLLGGVFVLIGATVYLLRVPWAS